MAQDAGLGRGTESLYLDILNHLGIQYDENAPMGVSDEEMRIIGPDNTIRRLEKEWSSLEAALQAKYGNSTRAAGADGKMRVQKANELRAARQRRRRKAADLLHKDHFKKRNNTELDRQLRGIHGPQQPLQKVVFSLPEWRLLAEILGDLDEDLPETEIVQRKIAAINAWIDYAWKVETKESDPSQSQGVPRTPSTEVTKRVETSQAVLELPIHGRTVVPKPQYVSMIQNQASPAAPICPGTAAFQDPPPPYSEIEVDSRVCSSALMGRGDVEARSRPQKRGHKCIFCGRPFTRKGTLWDCADRHFKRHKSEAVPCPRPECKSKGVVLDDEIRFKNDAIVAYGVALRPKITIRRRPTETLSPEREISTPKIVVAWREEKPTRSPRIVFPVGRGT